MFLFINFHFLAGTWASAFVVFEHKMFHLIEFFPMLLCSMSFVAELSRLQSYIKNSEHQLGLIQCKFYFTAGNSRAAWCGCPAAWRWLWGMVFLPQDVGCAPRLCRPWNVLRRHRGAFAGARAAAGSWGYSCEIPGKRRGQGVTTLCGSCSEHGPGPCQTKGECWREDHRRSQESLLCGKRSLLSKEGKGWETIVVWRNFRRLERKHGRSRCRTPRARGQAFGKLSLILGVRKWICTSPRQGSDPKLVFESLYFYTSLWALDVTWENSPDW